MASQGYSDERLEPYYDPETGKCEKSLILADTLAAFIVMDLESTFTPSAPNLAQLDEAIRAMTIAKEDLESVIKVLER